METRCIACGGPLEPGSIRARNRQSGAFGKREPFMVVSEFAFIRPGTPTSANPIASFVQGFRDEPADQPMPLDALRCTGCGRVELFAAEE